MLQELERKIKDETLKAKNRKDEVVASIKLYEFTEVAITQFKLLN